MEWRNEDGSWSFALRYQVDGKRRQELVARVPAEMYDEGRRYAEMELAGRRYEWRRGTRHPAGGSATWADARDAWLQWGDKHRAASTVRRYRDAWAHWLSWEDAPEAMRDTGLDDLEAYQDHRLGEEASPATVNFEIATLKSLWRWAQKPARGMAPAGMDPFTDVEELVAPKAGKRILTPEEIGAFRRVAPAYLVPVFDFALHTGLRKGELIWLDAGDVDLEERVVHVRSKRGHALKAERASRGGKDRRVPLPDQAVDAYERQLEIKRQRGWDTHIVFPNPGEHGPGRKGGAPKPPGTDRFTKLGGVVRYWLQKKAGIRASLHACRHTYCTMALIHTRDLRKVQAWMGHGSIETTEQYLHYLPEHEREAMRDFRL